MQHQGKSSNAAAYRSSRQSPASIREIHSQAEGGGAPPRQTAASRPAQAAATRRPRPSRRLPPTCAGAAWASRAEAASRLQPPSPPPPPAPRSPEARGPAQDPEGASAGLAATLSRRLLPAAALPRARRLRIAPRPHAPFRSERREPPLRQPPRQLLAALRRCAQQKKMLPSCGSVPRSAVARLRRTQSSRAASAARRRACNSTRR